MHALEKQLQAGTNFCSSTEMKKIVYIINAAGRTRILAVYIHSLTLLKLLQSEKNDKWELSILCS